jgi:hypothetical protein
MFSTRIAVLEIGLKQAHLTEGDLLLSEELPDKLANCGVTTAIKEN